MADSDKDILIVPNTGETSDPTITFSSGATGGDPITLSVVDDGTTSALSFTASSGNLLYLENGGNIGIGTNNPGSQLHLSKSGGTLIKLGTSQNTSEIEARESGASNLLVFSSNNSVDHLVINGVGNVGIGTSNPERTLHVSSTNTIPARIESSETTSVIQYVNSGQTQGANTWVGSTNDDFYFFVGGGERVRIKGSGNVGIGTTNPGAKLQVEGGNIVHYANAVSASLTTGRNSNENIVLATTDGAGSLTYNQDETDGTDHSFNFIINSPGTNSHRFTFNEPLTAQGEYYSGISENAWAFRASTSGTSNDSGLWFTGTTARLLLRDSSGTLKTMLAANGTNSQNVINGNTIWHAGNDGAGSGLDADTLDSLQASQFLRNDTSGTLTGTLTTTGAVSAYNGNIELLSNGIYFEAEKHAITWNDGGGNFNIRVGNTFDTSELCTEIGYAFQDEWLQSIGLREFNVSSASLGIGDSISWRTQLSYDSSSVYLRYQGSTRLTTTSDGISVTGDVTASTFNGALNGNASTASKWSNARTITLSGDVSGSVSIDGSANATITTTVANDSHTHDGRYYTESESDTRYPIKSASNLFTGGQNDFTGIMRWFVSSADTAHQRADVRDDATNFSRMHWYGISDAGAVSNFRHAWYDGTNYVNVTINSSGRIDFTGSAASMYIGSDRVFDDGYHPNADKWTIARTLSLTGDVTGTSAAFDGSGNISFSTTVGDDTHNHNFLTVIGITDLNAVPNVGTDRFRPFISEFQATNRPSGNYFAGFDIGLRASNYRAQFGFTPTGDINAQGPWYRQLVNGTWDSWAKVWTSANDGAASGLDADLLDGIQASRIPYALSSGSGGGIYGTTNTFVTDGGIGADNIARSMFFRDNNNQFSALGIHVAHSNNANYAWQIGVNSYSDSSLLQARVKNNGTWETPVTIWNSGNDGSGSGLDADTLDGVQGSSFLRSDANDSFSGLLTGSGNAHITFGPNTSWSSYLRVGGNGRSVSGNAYASVATTNGNLHLDAGDARTLYLNYYAGTGGVYFGTGQGGNAALMTSGGDLYKGTSTSGFKYWHAGNHGAGSTLDADKLDGQEGSFYRNASNLNAGIVPAARIAHNSLNVPSAVPETGRNVFETGIYTFNTNNASLGDSTPTSYWSTLAWGAGTSGSAQLSASWTGSGLNLYFRSLRDTIDDWWAWKKIWHEANDGPGSGLNADVLDGYQHTAFGPVVARWYASGSNSTGRLGIRLPFLTNSAIMLSFVISQYTGYTYHEYKVSGYLYPTTNNWYVPKAVYTGTGTPDIVFGRDTDGIAYVSIADGNYTGVTVHSVNIGYTSTQATMESRTYNQGWQIVQSGLTPNSTTATVYKTWNNQNDGSGSGLDADLLDGLHATSFIQRTGVNNGVIDIRVDDADFIIRDSTDTVSNYFWRDHSENILYLGTANAVPTLRSTLNMNSNTILNYSIISNNAAQSRDKLRVWNSSLYTIGFKSGYTYGHLTNYAMSFQIDTTADRGWWWGRSNHSDAQGSMALTEEGRLTVATSISVGEGQSITSPSSETLYVAGNATFTSGGNTQVLISSPAASTATLNIRGTSGQGSGVLYVGQDSSYGGGIEYNGDNSPATSGAGADYIALYRRDNNVLSWTARNFVTNNDWEFRGNVTASAFISTNDMTVSGLRVASGGLISDPQEGKYYKYFLVGTGIKDDLWKKVCDVSIDASLYRALEMRITLYSSNSNFGNTANGQTSVYTATYYRSGNTQDVPNDAVIHGEDTDNHGLRIIKTATGSYELQILQKVNYKDAIVDIEVQSTNGGTVTMSSGIVNGSTTGTVYTPTVNTSIKLLMPQGEMATVASVPTNNNQLTNGAGYITNSGGTEAATASTVVKRTAQADIWARLLRSTYASQTTAPASTARIAFRNDDGASDNYIRTMTNGAFVSWLNGQTGVDSDSVGGLSVHAGRNNEANKVVRTDGNGYIQAGWINTTSGATTNTISRIYASNDAYIRYVTPATFISQLGLISGNVTGSLFADVIAANTITADMIQANSVVAEIITAEKISAGSLVAGSVTVGTSTSTLKLYDDCLKIFESGNLRVKLGNLSNTTDE